MLGRLAKYKRELLAFVVLLSPTIAGFFVDILLRGRTVWELSARSKYGYFASSMLGFGLWFAVLFGLARLAQRGSMRAYYAVFAFFIAPFALIAYGVQPYYFTVFQTYFSRDTLRLGLAFHGTVQSWIDNFGPRMIPGLLATTAGIVALAIGVRRIAPFVPKMRWFVPPLAAIGCFVLLWMDLIVSTEFLRTPDAALQNAIVGLAKDTVQPRAKRGLAHRPSAVVPDFPRRARRPHVVVVVTESIRTDVLCAEKSDACKSRFLDDVIPDRVGLLRATSQSSGTITSCVSLWTGLGPDASFEVAHTTPLVWEVARKAGYRTAYIAAQDLRAFDLGPFIKNGGIDIQTTAEDFGDVQEIHLGSADERALVRAVDLLKTEATAERPLFMVVHLANTHYPYRVDPALQPFEPHESSPFPQSIDALKNHIKNSVLLQERSVAELYRSLRALPAFADTVTIFLSDHGEQLREHGALFHLNSLYDEEVRVPAWVVAGPNALDEEQRAALAAYHDRRVYSQDFNATILDLLGALEQRPAFPNGARLSGRSIFRAPPAEEPVVTMATASGVWFDDDPVFGVMSGETKVMTKEGSPWVCYDLAKDPKESKRAPDCPPALLAAARSAFPSLNK